MEKIDEALFEAIRAKDPNRVIGLLKMGASANAYDGAYNAIELAELHDQFEIMRILKAHRKNQRTK